MFCDTGPSGPWDVRDRKNNKEEEAISHHAWDAEMMPRDSEMMQSAHDEIAALDEHWATLQAHLPEP